MSGNGRVLIVDDNPYQGESAQELLRDHGYDVEYAANAAGARRLAHDNCFDLLITDLRMPGEGGIDLIRHFRQTSPATRIIVITAYPDQENVSRTETLEISSFLVKPFSFDQLNCSVARALHERRLARDDESMTQALDRNRDLGLVGCSPYIESLRTSIATAASGDFPVLVHGPSGTGKEIIAQAIHAQSPRGGRNLVSINCAAVPRHLEESEFFGHTRGAFTGAAADKQGIVACADRTSLFLDEIGELSPETQAKLLRVLDCGQYLPVGRTTPCTTDTRIISVTNRNLEEMVEKGTFRADLYYRIRGAVIPTRPLSHHREDIPVLVRHFLNSSSAKGSRKEITREALEALCSRDWPGNIRELKHTVHLLATSAAGRRRVNADDVRQGLSGTQNIGSATSPPAYHEARQRLLESFDRDYFDDLLKRHLGNISRAAASCGLARPYLQRKLKNLGIDSHAYRR